MDVKRYDLGKDQEHVCDCDMMDWPDGEFVMYEDIKHLREPMTTEEAERLVDRIVEEWFDFISNQPVIHNENYAKYHATKAKLIAALTGKEAV